MSNPEGSNLPIPPSYGMVVAAGVLAGIGWTALAVDFLRTLLHAVLLHESMPRVLFGYFRFFTILTNVFVAGLMSATAARAVRVRPLPRPSLFRAATVYAIVMGVTYEVLLRHLWSPKGVQFATDLAFHDLVPALTVLFWMIYAPKRLQWRDLPWLLAYPLGYFAVTLVDGALGAGYPYDFLDAGRLGYPSVIVIGVAFLAAFLLLGAVLTVAGRAITGGRRTAV